MECAKLPTGVRKVKKKQVKDEFDRRKQAEKKKRRLEKALATSAAIISELEKKKEKKKEEQQRLDEEGAAIAEAVALNVLLGEDSDDPCKIMMRTNEGFNSWDCASNIDLYMDRMRSGIPHHELSNHSHGLGFGWVSNVHGSEWDWNDCGNGDWLVTSSSFGRNFNAPYFVESNWNANDISVELIAAQAVSSLQIAEDSHVDSLVFNGM